MAQGLFFFFQITDLLFFFKIQTERVGFENMTE